MLTNPGKHLGVAPSEVNTDYSLLDLGLDSLSTVELALELQRHLPTSPPVADLLAYPSVDALLSGDTRAELCGRTAHMTPALLRNRSPRGPRACYDVGAPLGRMCYGCANEWMGSDHARVRSGSRWERGMRMGWRSWPDARPLTLPDLPRRGLTNVPMLVTWLHAMAPTQGWEHA